MFGTPSEEDWPEVVDLPNYLPFNDTPAGDLSPVLAGLRKKTDPEADATGITAEAIDLLKTLL